MIFTFLVKYVIISIMLIPGEVCNELTKETAHRLNHGGSFTTYGNMHASAQHQLQMAFQRLGHENKHEVGDLRLRNKSLALAALFFARDPEGSLLTVPWVRSPEGSSADYHIALIREFENIASDNHEGVRLHAPINSFLDYVGGLIIPHEDSMVFLANNYTETSAEYDNSITQSQQLMAEYGVALHVQVGKDFLRSDVDASR